METLQKAIQKMGSNFIVASLVPAMGFVVFTFVAFLPIMPPAVNRYWDQLGGKFGEIAVIALLFTTLIGFTMYTLSTFIFKSFEGYTFIMSVATPLGRAGLKRQKKRVKRIETELRRLQHVLDNLERRMQSLLEKPLKKRTVSDLARLNRYHRRTNMLEGQQYSLAAEYNLNFPPKEMILPTRFGNILRAAETYPGKRYGIDSVEIWGRLAHLIPREGMGLVDQSHNECLFLLNSSVLATISGIMCLLASAYQCLLSMLSPEHDFLLYFIPIDSDATEYLTRAGIYVVLFVSSLASAWFFYVASLLNVGQFGAMIRSSYDLYRFNLIQALHLKLPKTLSKEYALWEQVSNFFATGGDVGAEIEFTYSHKK